MVIKLTSYLGFLLLVSGGLRGQSTGSWAGYARDSQHTGVSPVAAQPLNRIKWSRPVDLELQNTPGPLSVHYGSPLVTASNTVIISVRTSESDTFRLDVVNGADGTLKYSLESAWTPPDHNWTPVFAPVLTPANRLYYPGPGGTVLFRDQPDGADGSAGQIAFFGNAVYGADPGAFDSTVQIATPIVSDCCGDIFFGIRVSGTNPAGLASGIARISADGTGSYITALAASGGDGSISSIPLNCAPALSLDDLTLYFAVSTGSNGDGYLVSVNSRSLAPVAHARLFDPAFGTFAAVIDDSSASPTVGPDGDVYFGVYATSCCTNQDKGWLLHFDKTLTQARTPGAFGWDDTTSIVPSAMVPSYNGTSSYLLFSKYNNPSETGGDGINRIAILDPNATQIDATTGVAVMREVMTLAGMTPDGDPESDPDGSVREWCVNSAAVDPITKSVIASSEDGVVYRWDLTSNTFTESLRLADGTGETSTPTVIGVDGTGYAISNAVLFAFGQ